MNLKTRGTRVNIPEQLAIYSSRLELAISTIAESLNQLVLMRATIEKDIETLKKEAR